MLLVRQGLPRRPDLKGVFLAKRQRRGDVSMRNAVVPGEMVLVPEGPEKAEHHRATGKQISERTPLQLAVFGEVAVEPHHVKPAKLHSRRGAAEDGEDREIESVEENKRRAIDSRIHAREIEVAAERAEQAKKADIGQRKEN